MNDGYEHKYLAGEEQAWNDADAILEKVFAIEAPIGKYKDTIRKARETIKTAIESRDYLKAVKAESTIELNQRALALVEEQLPEVINPIVEICDAIEKFNTKHSKEANEFGHKECTRMAFEDAWPEGGPDAYRWPEPKFHEHNARIMELARKAKLLRNAGLLKDLGATPQEAPFFGVRGAERKPAPKPEPGYTINRDFNDTSRMVIGKSRAPDSRGGDYM